MDRLAQTVEGLEVPWQGAQGGSYQEHPRGTTEVRWSLYLLSGYNAALPSKVALHRRSPRVWGLHIRSYTFWSNGPRVFSGHQMELKFTQRPRGRILLAIRPVSPKRVEAWTVRPKRWRVWKRHGKAPRAEVARSTHEPPPKFGGHCTFCLATMRRSQEGRTL